MTFEVTILGSNSALPAHGRHPTSQVINLNEQLYLIDCGEATQIQLARYKVRVSKIEHIFISHLHGDHYFGLIGLITSYNLLGRTIPLNICGPAGLEEIIKLQLKHSDTQLRFPLIFHHFDPENGKLVFENDQLEVISLEMHHRIPCSGFIFKEKPSKLNIRPEKITEYELSFDQIKNAKNGQDVKLSDGRVILNSELCLPPGKPRNYAYCTDTLYNEDILPYIKGADLLYHEATFDKSRLVRAHETFHSTSEEAGTIAQKAEVKKLIVGHFSSRYKEPEMQALLEETQSVFPNSELAIEGTTFEL